VRSDAMAKDRAAEVAADIKAREAKRRKQSETLTKLVGMTRVTNAELRKAAKLKE